MLDKTGQITLKNLKNEVAKKFTLATPPDQIFYAGTGNLLLSDEETVTLFDVQQKRCVAAAPCYHVSFLLFF